jgi:hypothetical protein
VEDDVAEGEPRLQTAVGNGKGEVKQKATTAAPSATKLARKRKNKAGDDTEDNPPSKRQKADATVMREPRDAEVATDHQATGDVRQLATSNGIAASTGIICSSDQREEAVGREIKVPMEGSHMESTMKPTRRQPPRAASRKSVP